MKNDELLKAIELIKNKEFHQAELILDKFMGAENSSSDKSYAYYFSYLVNLGLGKKNAAELYFENFLSSCFDDENVTIEKGSWGGGLLVKHDNIAKRKELSYVSINKSLIYILQTFLPKQINIESFP